MPLSPSKRQVIFLSLGTAYSFALHFWSLQQSSFANGWDSYFYLVQIKSYLEEGAMVSSRISLFYPFLIGIKALVGDYVLAWKVAGALLCSVFALLNYLLLRSIGVKRSIAALGFALATSSPHLFYFSAQYLKNLMGIDFALIFLILLFRKKLPWALLTFVLTLFTHKAALILALLAFLVHTIVNWQRERLKWLVLGISILALTALLVPVVFSLNDLMRDSSIIANQLHFSYTSFIQSSGIQLTPWWISELIITLLALPAFWFLYRKSTSRIWILALSLQVTWLVFNLPLWSMDRLGYGFRFFLQAALLAPIFVALCTTRVSKTSWLHLGTIFVFAISIFCAKTYRPESHDPPYAKYHIIQHRLHTHPDFEQTELYIAHKGLAEYIKFSCGKDAMAWVPEYEIAENRLYRIVKTDDFDVIYNNHTPEEYRDAWHRLSAFYFVIPEHIWHDIYSKIAIDDPDLFSKLSTWLNPSSQRPGYMKKYKAE